MDIKLRKPSQSHDFRVGDIFKDGGCIRLIATNNCEEYCAVAVDGQIGFTALTLETLLEKYGEPEFIGRLEIQV